MINTLAHLTPASIGILAACLFLVGMVVGMGIMLVVMPGTEIFESQEGQRRG